MKLPSLTRVRRDLEQRFARERDILASLEHPHIARLYDAGIDPHGLPYLSMEYVQGELLTDWCDAQRLDIRARLRLFLQVLGAVQYAHERQVIHRDLKPSNILVTKGGEVRLLDFGVATLLDDGEAAGKTPLTTVYGHALTPIYASPELIRGEPVTAKSDIYSLGVVLFELLTGDRPYRLNAGASRALLEHAIAAAEVRKPSTQIIQDAWALPERHPRTAHPPAARRPRSYCPQGTREGAAGPLCKCRRHGGRCAVLSRWQTHLRTRAASRLPLRQISAPQSSGGLGRGRGKPRRAGHPTV